MVVAGRDAGADAGAGADADAHEMQCRWCLAIGTRTGGRRGVEAHVPRTYLSMELLPKGWSGLELAC